MSHALNLNQLDRLQEALMAYRRLALYHNLFDDHRLLRAAHSAVERCDEPTQDCLKYVGILSALVDFDVVAP